MTTIDYDILIKLVLIGDSGVGKTCVMIRFADDTFCPSHIATVGIDFKIRTVVIDCKIVKLQIWDTAGQERYSTITTAFYRGAEGIMLVYDITNQRSYENIAKWLRDIDEYAETGVSKMILGNKCDMERHRVISKAEATAMAREYSTYFVETSAKDNINLTYAFIELATSILRKQKEQERRDTAQADRVNVSLREPYTAPQSKCCK